MWLSKRHCSSQTDPYPNPKDIGQTIHGQHLTKLSYDDLHVEAYHQFDCALSFPLVHSINSLSFCACVATWCGQWRWQATMWRREGERSSDLYNTQTLRYILWEMIGNKSLMILIMEPYSCTYQTTSLSMQLLCVVAHGNHEYASNLASAAGSPCRQISTL